MAKTLKVYGGIYRDGMFEHRVIIAASSIKEVAKATGHPPCWVKTQWFVTGNPSEIDAATKQPGVPLVVGYMADGSPTYETGKDAAVRIPRGKQGWRS
jgi:hypothetical protein